MKKIISLAACLVAFTFVSCNSNSTESTVETIDSAANAVVETTTQKVNDAVDSLKAGVDSVKAACDSACKTECKK